MHLFNLNPPDDEQVSAPAEKTVLPKESRILDEQVRLLYTQAPVAIGTGLLVAGIITAVIRDQAEPLRLGIWMGALVVISLVRLVLVRAYNRQSPGGAQVLRWRAWYTFSALCAGLVWGSLAFILDASWPIEYQLLVFMGLAGIAAGAIASNAVIFSVYVVFAIPAILPMGVILLIESNSAYVTMGSLVLLFPIALMVIAYKFSQNVTNSLLLGQEKQELVDKVSAINLNLQNEVKKYKRAEAARNQSQAMAIAFGQILDDSLNEIYIFDAETLKFVQVNKGARHNLGYSMDEMRNLTALDLKPDMALEDFERLLGSLRSGEQEIIQFETRHRRKDGSFYPVEVYLQSAVLGSVPVFVAMILDVSERKNAEDKLQQAAAVFANISDAVLITDPDARITAVNAAFTEITGYTEHEVLGSNPSTLQSGKQDHECYKNPWISLADTDRWQGEVWNRRKDGVVFPVWQTISAVRDQEGVLTHFVSVFSDISAIKQSQERVRYLAYHDALTDLPNRLLFDDRLTHAIQRAHRNGSTVALLFVDLDRFKSINDTLGHSMGDLVLQEVAGRLLSCVREEDTVARLGGDEFALILEEVSDAIHVARVAEQVIRTLSCPIDLKGQTVCAGASVGISLYPDDGDDAATLLEGADTAMYYAKNRGRSNYQFYTSEPRELCSD